MCNRKSSKYKDSEKILYLLDFSKYELIEFKSLFLHGKKPEKEGFFFCVAFILVNPYTGLAPGLLREIAEKALCG